MAHIRQILANLSISVAEFKKSPKTVIKAVKNEPIAVIIDDKPAFYCVPADILESLYQKFYEMNDMSLQHLQELNNDSPISHDDTFGVNDIFQSLEDEQEVSLSRNDLVDPISNNVADPLDEEVANQVNQELDRHLRNAYSELSRPREELKDQRLTQLELDELRELDKLDELRELKELEQSFAQIDAEQNALSDHNNNFNFNQDGSPDYQKESSAELHKDEAFINELLQQDPATSDSLALKHIEDKAVLREVIRDVRQEIIDGQKRQSFVPQANLSLERVATAYRPYVDTSEFNKGEVKDHKRFDSFNKAHQNILQNMQKSSATPEDNQLSILENKPTSLASEEVSQNQSSLVSPDLNAQDLSSDAFPEDTNSEMSADAADLSSKLAKNTALKQSNNLDKLEQNPNKLEQEDISQQTSLTKESLKDTHLELNISDELAKNEDQAASASLNYQNSSQQSLTKQQAETTKLKEVAHVNQDKDAQELTCSELTKDVSLSMSKTSMSPAVVQPITETEKVVSDSPTSSVIDDATQNSNPNTLNQSDISAQQEQNKSKEETDEKAIKAEKDEKEQAENSEKAEQISQHQPRKTSTIKTTTSNTKDTNQNIKDTTCQQLIADASESKLSRLSRQIKEGALDFFCKKTDISLDSTSKECSEKSLLGYSKQKDKEKVKVKDKKKTKKDKKKK